jgi:hypothetical protein
MVPQLTCGTLYHAVLVRRKTGYDQTYKATDHEDL